MKTIKLWKQLALITIWAAFQTTPTAQATDAGNEYVTIYSIIVKGDEMLASGLSLEAAQFYQDAHQKLVTFRNAHPNWNHQVIRFRLKYLAEKLADHPELTTTPTNPTNHNTTPPDATSPTTDHETQKQQLEQQLAALNEQLHQLSADNSLLLSKLREALSARPAAIEPAQIRKAEQKILELEKENQLIEIQLQNALKTKNQTTTTTEADLNAARQTATQLRQDNEHLQNRIADLTQKINQSNNQTIAINQQLQKTSQERDNLKNQLNQPPPTSPPNQTQPPTNHQTTDYIDTIEELMRENAQLRRQASESEPTQPTPSAKTQTAQNLSDRIKTLEKENRTLADKLAKNRPSTTQERSNWFSRITRRNNNKNLTPLQARLTVLEAQKEPYTPEELALLKKTNPENLNLPNNTATTSPPPTQLTQEAAKLETEAQEAARNKTYDIAETKFTQILQLIPNHTPTLASLALTQIQQNKLQAAETNLQTALELAPENSYALFLTGLLKMNQQKFDEAVTYLSQATVLDPDDAEAQNHLGVALTEIGHRAPAETALRKAIRLRPGYADAHINLAVVYASQKPPFTELAKYHYQRAIQAGHPADPRIEQLLNEN